MKSAQTFCKYLYRESENGVIFLKICSLFIILVSYLLTSLNAQATIMPCNICGVGEYKQLKHKDYLNFPKSEEKSCFDKNKLAFYEYTYSYEENPPLAFEESDKQYLAKCSYCAELLYINGWCDKIAASKIDYRVKGYPIMSICACAACALTSSGIGVYLCQLNSVTGYVFGSMSFIKSSMLGIYSSYSKCFRKENTLCNKICDINKKIQEILKIKYISDTKDSIAMTIDNENEVKEIHRDGCFFDTLVKDQISICHNTSFGKSDIRTITKEEVMVISLYEIWAINRNNTVGHEKICDNSWIKFHKARNYALDKRCSSYLKKANNLSISSFTDKYNSATASENNIDIDAKDYDTGQINYHNDIQSNKLLLIKTQLSTWAEDHETIKSFIISITFENNGSIQILFDKDKEIGNGWNIHYPELLEDNIYNISLGNMIEIFNFLSNSDNKLNYKDVKIIIPEVLSLD